MDWTACPELTAPTFDRNSVKAVHRTWLAALEADRSPDIYEGLYRTHLDLLRNGLSPASQTGPGLFARLFGRKEQPQTTDPAFLYRWISCFSSDRFLPRAHGRSAMQQQLVPIWAAYLALIDQMLERPDHSVTDTPLPQETGSWGDIVAGTLLAIRAHCDFGPQGRRLCSEAATRVPTLLTKYPDTGGAMLLGLMAQADDLAAPLARVIAHRVRLDRDLETDRVLVHCGLEMTGFHARRDDPLRKAGSAIMPELAQQAANWPEAQQRKLIEALALIPLNIIIGDQAFEIKKFEQRIARETDKIDNGFSSIPVGMSAKQLTDMAHKRLKQAKADLKVIQTDFDAHRTDRLQAAANHLRKATPARKMAEALATTLPDQVTAPLPEVVMLAKGPAQAASTLPMPTASGPHFADFGFKLLVIEELMYVQKVLSPAFDLRIFAKEWEAREISIEDDGYAIIPEVRDWFAALPIPSEALALVQCLEQSGGLDGGPRFMRHLYPFWDPGAGDTAFPVTDAAVADLDLLPNLRSVSGLEQNDPAPTALLDALDERGIETIPEEWVAFGPR